MPDTLLFPHTPSVHEPKKPTAVDQVYYNEFGMTNLNVPEVKLYVAVIQRAILDYAGRGRGALENKRSARIFLFEDDPDKSPLRYYVELIFSNPDGFISRLRDDVLAGKLHPKQVSCFTC